MTSLSVSELADYANLSRSQIYYLIKVGKLPFTKIGQKLFFNLQDIYMLGSAEYPLSVLDPANNSGTSYYQNARRLSDIVELVEDEELDTVAYITEVEAA